ncbi:MAG: sulfatase-like hydrolase/transferase [Pseudomonadota bacterium]
MGHKLLIACLCLIILPVSVASETKPNIILLIGNDHGAPYFGFMGDKHVYTPNMDFLANNGVTFTQGYSSANHCRPSQRTLITGLHPVQYQQQLLEIIDKKRAAEIKYANFNAKEKSMWTTLMHAEGMKEFDTLPKLLNEQGYVSWQGGIWWENSYKNGHFTHGMTKGMDMDKFARDDFFFEMMGSEGVELGRGTMAPLFDFISQNKDKPFFVWYSPALPHSPFNAPAEHAKHYEDKYISDSAKLYYANITWWDHGVGQVIDHVKKEGILENTVFIYINDNGWVQEPDAEYKQENHNLHTDINLNHGGEKGKLGLYNQSFLTPVIFYWNNRFQHNTDNSTLVSMEDIFPTILDLAGIENEKLSSELPGFSLKPILEGETTDLRDAIVGYTHQRRNEQSAIGTRAEGYYVRKDNWFFRWYKDIDIMELYDVNADPHSNDNVISKFPHLIDGFKTQVEDWKESIDMIEAIPLS